MLERATGCKMVYLHDGSGVFPLALIRSRLFGDRLVSVPYSDRGGPCTLGEHDASGLVRQAHTAARETKVDFVEIRSPDEKHSPVLAEEGYIRRDDYFTYLLSLDRSAEDLWKGIGDKNRNMVRKAGRSGVQIRWGESEADLRLFYALYCHTMKRLGSPPHPYRFFATMWELFYPEGLLMPMAVHDQECIAAGLFSMYDGVIHHDFSCSLGKYLHLAPNNLIVWEVIEWGQRHGCRLLDFGRTRENAGNELFKRRWGGQRRSLPYYYRYYRGGPKARPEVAYGNLATFWRVCVPQPVADKVGPWIKGQIG